MRSSPIRVPLFSYFAVAIPVLLGLLYTAEAVMGPPGPMPMSTPAPMIAAKHKPANEAVPILTVRQAVPVPQSELITVGSLAQAAVAPAETAKIKAARAATEHKKKPVRVARTPKYRDQYAGAVQPWSNSVW